MLMNSSLITMPPERSRKLKDRGKESETESQRKTRERQSLARTIEDIGNEMIPCSLCKRQNRKCVVRDDKLERCAKCVRHKCSCDVKVPLADQWEQEVPSMNDWESLDRQVKKLRAEEEEVMAKILRLRKQQDFLYRRKEEMSRRGLRFLDELDALEEKERKEAEEAAKEVTDEVDPSGPSLLPGDFFDDPNLSPFPWEDPGVDGEMLQANPGS